MLSIGPSNPVDLPPVYGRDPKEVVAVFQKNQWRVRDEDYRTRWSVPKEKVAEAVARYNALRLRVPLQVVA